MSAIVSEHDAKRAGAEIVKQTDNAPLSGLLYPILQVLDEQYLDVDAQFGGLDQRKLFIAAKEWLPKMGYRERAHLCNAMIPGIQGAKMSSRSVLRIFQPDSANNSTCNSDPDSKIDLLDGPDVVTKKIRKAVATPGVVEDNGILALIEHVLLPAAGLSGTREFQVDRSRDGLEPLVYTTIEKIHEDYKTDILSPQVLKPAVTTALNKLLAPILADYSASKEWQEVALKAYPPPPAAQKVKKVKNKGTRDPKLLQKEQAEGSAVEKKELPVLTKENQEN